MDTLKHPKWATIRVDRKMADELATKMNVHFNVSHGPISRNRAVNQAIVHALKTMFGDGKKDWIA